MDFKNLFSIIKKNFKFILIFTFIVIILVEVFFAWQSSGFNVSLALSVFSRVSQPSQSYQFDDYLSVKAADAYSDSVSQWVGSPEVINTVYQKAGLVPEKTLVGGSLKAQKMAANYVSVEFSVANEVDGKKIADALVSVLQDKTELANKYSGNAVFTILGGQPVIVKNKADFILDGIIALIGGAILAIFILLLKEDDSRN
jgi:capsular polysaccharide biosynthesis protein